MEIIRTDRVRNEEVLNRIKEEKNILQRRKANTNGHILRWNCLVKQVIEGKTGGSIEVMGRWGRRCKQLLVYLKAAFLKLWSADH